MQAPDGVVVELTAYALRGKLRAALPVLAGYNRLVHTIRRLIVRAAVARGRETVGQKLSASASRRSG